MSLQTALDDHLAGRLEQAARAYVSALAEDPAQPVALHYLGIYLHQVGRHDEAIEKLRQAQALRPDNADWHNDFGNVLFALERFDEASRSYAAAAELLPEDHVIQTSLGTAHLEAGRGPQAAAALERAVQLAPEYIPAMQQLARLHTAAGDNLAASRWQCRVFVLPPLEGKSHEMLGKAFYILGRYGEAAQAYRQWLQQSPGNPIAQHLLAACAQFGIPVRAADRYVEAHFDAFAEMFDANLVESLSYRGPQLIGEGLALIAAPARQFEAVDLGCGTGLCGQVLTPFCHRIVGLDLSTRMLEKAAARGTYTELHKTEIGAWLARNPLCCDLVVAADTLIYVGALDTLFGQVSQALRDDGHFIFTIERALPEDAMDEGFGLHASGRYRHRQEDVETLLRQHALQTLHCSPHPLRTEIGEPVAGLLFVARKRSNAAPIDERKHPHT